MDAPALALAGQGGILPGPDIVAHCERPHLVSQCEAWLANPAFQMWLAEAGRGAAPEGAWS